MTEFKPIPRRAAIDADYSKDINQLYENTLHLKNKIDQIGDEAIPDGSVTTAKINNSAPISFGNATQAIDKDTGAVIVANGGLAVEGNIALGGQIISEIADGTVPMIVGSTTMVDNLNAEFVGGIAGIDLAGTRSYIVAPGYEIEPGDPVAMTENGLITGPDIYALRNTEVIDNVPIGHTFDSVIKTIAMTEDCVLALTYTIADKSIHAVCFNPKNSSITSGTPVLIQSDVGSTDIDVCKLKYNIAVIAFLAPDYRGMASVLHIDGLTITAYTNYYTDAISISYPSVVPIHSDMVLLMGRSSGGLYARAARIATGGINIDIAGITTAYPSMDIFGLVAGTAIDDSRIALLFTNSAGQTYAAIATVIDEVTPIVFGTETIVYTHVAGGAPIPPQHFIQSINDGRCVVFSNIFASKLAYGKVLSIADTDITVGKINLIGNDIYEILDVTKISDSRMLLTYQDDIDSNTWSMVIGISGTSILSGSLCFIAPYDYVRTAIINEQMCVATFPNNVYDSLSVEFIELGTTNLSIGTQLSITSSEMCFIESIDESTALIAYSDDNNDGYGTIRIINMIGDELTMGNAIVIESALVHNIRMIKVHDGHFVVSYEIEIGTTGTFLGKFIDIIYDGSLSIKNSHTLDHIPLDELLVHTIDAKRYVVTYNYAGNTMIGLVTNMTLDTAGITTLYAGVTNNVHLMSTNSSGLIVTFTDGSYNIAGLVDLLDDGLLHIGDTLIYDTTISSDAPLSKISSTNVGVFCSDYMLTFGPHDVDQTMLPLGRRTLHNGTGTSPFAIGTISNSRILLLSNDNGTQCLAHIINIGDGKYERIDTLRIPVSAAYAADIAIMSQTSAIVSILDSGSVVLYGMNLDRAQINLDNCIGIANERAFSGEQCQITMLSAGGGCYAPADHKILSITDPVEFCGEDAIAGPDMTLLSDSAGIVAFADSWGIGQARLVRIAADGYTITQTEIESVIYNMAMTLTSSVVTVNETQALVLFSGMTDPEDPTTGFIKANIINVNAPGTELSIGTEVDIANGHSMQNKLIQLDSNSFLALYCMTIVAEIPTQSIRARVLNISSGIITMGDEVSLGDGLVYCDGVAILPSKVLVGYTSGVMYDPPILEPMTRVLTITGTTITMDTPVSHIPNGSQGVLNSGMVELSSGNVVVTYLMFNNQPGTTFCKLAKWNGSSFDYTDAILVDDNAIISFHSRLSDTEFIVMSRDNINNSFVQIFEVDFTNDFIRGGRKIYLTENTTDTSYFSKLVLFSNNKRAIFPYTTRDFANVSGTHGVCSIIDLGMILTQGKTFYLSDLGQLSEAPVQRTELDGTITIAHNLLIGTATSESWLAIDNLQYNSPVSPVTNLNADMVDGYHAGNASDNIPVSNGIVNTNLNADMVDGYHAEEFFEHDIVILTQTEFDAVFTGTISENTSIFIKKKETPYLLNNAVVLSSNVRITSDGAIVNRGSATARFSTTYKNLTTYAGGGAIGETTFNRNAGVPFVAGDSIVHTGNKFYTVVSDTTTESVGGTVTISTPVKDIPISGSIYSCQHSIYTDGWIFDGQGNVNGLGPSTGAFTFDGHGGAFNLAFCVNSTFKAEVRNCALMSGWTGGAYSGDHSLGSLGTYNLIIENISNCTAESGGGCASCNYSTISNISYCTASHGGGGCYLCESSTISNIYGCTATGGGGGCHGCYYSTISNISYCSAADVGGGCYSCEYSTISNIRYCSAESGGGGGCHGCNYSTISNINNCSAAISGGGCYGCNYSTISNISYCSAATTGGGCHGCYYSHISNIYGCTADTNGGGCYGCYYSHISNINNCSADTSGGGCDSCNYCFFYGDWSNNSGPAPQNISLCTYGIAFCTDGTAAAYTVATRAATALSY